MEEKGEIAAEIFVRGMVQGVGFRYFAQNFCQTLGLTGQCRNLSDGQVQIFVEGSRPVIETLIQHLKEGPPQSSVSQVCVQWKSCTGRFSDFTIAH